MTAAVNYEFRSEFLRNFAAKNRAEGRALGEADAVLTVLAARSIDVPDDARDRIANCQDLEQLDIWIRRAANSTTVNDLFES